MKEECSVVAFLSYITMLLEDTQRYVVYIVNHRPSTKMAEEHT
jgi:hypothetical protein